VSRLQEGGWRRRRRQQVPAPEQPPRPQNCPCQAPAIHTNINTLKLYYPTTCHTLYRFAERTFAPPDRCHISSTLFELLRGPSWSSEPTIQRNRSKTTAHIRNMERVKRLAAHLMPGSVGTKVRGVRDRCFQSRLLPPRPANHSEPLPHVASMLNTAAQGRRAGRGRRHRPAARAAAEEQQPGRRAEPLRCGQHRRRGRGPVAHQHAGQGQGLHRSCAAGRRAQGLSAGGDPRRFVFGPPPAACRMLYLPRSRAACNPSYHPRMHHHQPSMHATTAPPCTKTPPPQASPASRA